jgi:diguanylate cyclase (GGDEF)-like protein
MARLLFGPAQTPLPARRIFKNSVQHRRGGERMKTRALNGGEHASLAVHPSAQRPRDAGSPGRLRSAPSLPDTTELHRALAASEQQLGAALGQIDALQRQDSHLRQEVDRLAQAVLQARQFAHHDPLTGLPNRVLLLDRFKQAVARANRQHKQVVLLFLDLDGFKSINDAFGHAGGDRLLQQVAARLAACIRASDTACRYGGDEFVVLLSEIEGQESAVAAAEKIRAQLATPYVVDGSAIEVKASIGMAIYPVDGHEYCELIQVSDLAMYRSKARCPAEPGVPESAFGEA